MNPQVSPRPSGGGDQLHRSLGGFGRRPEDLSEKDAQDRHLAIVASLTPSTFDNEVTDAHPRGNYSKPRLCWVTIITRMMQSDMVSPFRRTFCNRCHVSASICICHLPFGKRRRVSSNGNSAAIRVRHSSVISISGIALEIFREPVLGRAGSNRPNRKNQPVKSQQSCPQRIGLRHLNNQSNKEQANITVYSASFSTSPVNSAGETTSSITRTLRHRARP
jgi:hypothetical protein